MQVPGTVPGGYPEYPDPLRDGVLTVVVNCVRSQGALDAKLFSKQVSLIRTEAYSILQLTDRQMPQIAGMDMAQGTIFGQKSFARRRAHAQDLASWVTLFGQMALFVQRLQP